MLEILLLSLFLTFLDFAFTFSSGKRTFFKYVSLWPKWMPMALPNWNLRAYFGLWLRDASCASCHEIFVKEGMAVKSGLGTITLRLSGENSKSGELGDIRVTICYHYDCFSEGKVHVHADTLESLLILRQFDIPFSSKEFKACLSQEFNKLDDKDRIPLDSIVPGDVLGHKRLWEIRK